MQKFFRSQYYFYQTTIDRARRNLVAFNTFKAMLVFFCSETVFIIISFIWVFPANTKEFNKLFPYVLLPKRQVSSCMLGTTFYIPINSNLSSYINPLLQLPRSKSNILYYLEVNKLIIEPVMCSKYMFLIHRHVVGACLDRFKSICSPLAINIRQTRSCNNSSCFTVTINFNTELLNSYFYFPLFNLFTIQYISYKTPSMKHYYHIQVALAFRLRPLWHVYTIFLILIIVLEKFVKDCYNE